MKTIVINPVTRIEGHAQITIHLDDNGHVTDTAFHVTQLRGFEKFCEGRPFYEMPSITARICGICPISHLLTSAKACEAIMSVRIPPTAAKLREIMHCGQVIQSHALSFFYLSAPDLLLGFEFRSGPAQRHWRHRGLSATGQGWDRAASIRPAGDRGIGRGTHPPILDRSRRRQRSTRNRRPGPYPGGAARGQGDRTADIGFFQRCRR